MSENVNFKKYVSLGDSLRVCFNIYRTDKMVAKYQVFEKAVQKDGTVTWKPFDKMRTASLRPSWAFGKYFEISDKYVGIRYPKKRIYICEGRNI